MQKFKRLLVSAMILITLLAVTPLAAHAEWKQDSNGWWYAEGNSWVAGWKQIDGDWYYFENDGYMASGCYIENYYLNSKGAWTHLDYSTNNSKYNEFLRRLNEIEKNDSISSKQAYTTYDITMYSKKFNQQYDTLLNDIYNYLKEVMSESEFKKLQNEEIDWINTKETAMKNGLEEVKGGSMSAYVAGITSLGYTHDRIYDLLKYVN